MPSDRRGAADGDLAVARAPMRPGAIPWSARDGCGPRARDSPGCRRRRSGRGAATRGCATHRRRHRRSWLSPPRRPRWSIQVGPPGSVPGNTFVRLRGLPASVSLTEGYAIAPGSWAVPLFGLPSLKAIVPAGVSGRSEIIIHLVGVDGTTLAETRTALVVGPARPSSRRRSGPAAESVPPARSQRLPSRHRRLHTAPASPERSVQPPPQA